MQNFGKILVKNDRRTPYLVKWDRPPDIMSVKIMVLQYENPLKLGRLLLLEAGQFLHIFLSSVMKITCFQSEKPVLYIYRPYKVYN